MDARELLKDWPGWARANAARVLASPAWRLVTRFAGNPAVLTREETCEASFSLAITLDGATGVVSLAPTSLFPDLWLLRERIDALPREVLLALVEKECGALFQFFEDVGRLSFAVVGLSDAPSAGMAFRLTTEEGSVSFRIDLPASVELSLGQLANLDAEHESIRSLTREAWASYAALELDDAAAKDLAPGDCLVLPDDAEAKWTLDIPSEGPAHVVARESRTVTFGEVADDALGPVPPPSRVSIFRRGEIVASGTVEKLGEASVVRIV